MLLASTEFVTGFYSMIEAFVACTRLFMHHAVTSAISTALELWAVVVQTASSLQLHIYGFPTSKISGVVVTTGCDSHLNAT
jgi:hypothetical protein